MAEDNDVRLVAASDRSGRRRLGAGHEAGFKVVVRDAATKDVLTDRTFAVSWQSAPT